MPTPGVPGQAADDGDWPPLPELLALSMPSALLAIAMVVVLLGSVFGWNMLWSTDDVNLAERAALKDRAGVRDARIHGQDINAFYTPRRGLISDSPKSLTPLEAAISTRDIEMVRFVLDVGAVVSEQNRLRLACLGRGVGAEDIEAVFSHGESITCKGVETPW